MIIPVILETKFSQIEEKIRIADNFATLIQVDFADDTIFKGKTYLDIEKVTNIQTGAELDIHLMVKDPFEYLKKPYKNIAKLCWQIEADVDHKKAIVTSKKHGYATGISIGPDTDYSLLDNYVYDLDFVQFMDVVPGKQGGHQLPYVIHKIAEFRKTYPNIPIQVDGGIKLSNIQNLIDAGVNDFVVGSEIFASSNPLKMYIELSNMNKNKNDVNKVSSIAKNPIKIAFLGGAAWKEDDQPYKDAYEVAKVLAEAGYEIVNGGGPGVMRASTKGGHAGGARVLAVTYHPNKPKRHYEGVDPGNDFDDEIITLDYFDRTKVMLQTTKYHIVFKGSLGTLSEFGMSWISSWIHEPNNKPIVLYGDFWEDYLDLIDRYLLVTDNERSIVKICRSPQEVADYFKTFEK